MSGATPRLGERRLTRLREVAAHFTPPPRLVDLCYADVITRSSLPLNRAEILIGAQAEFEIIN